MRRLGWGRGSALTVLWVLVVPGVAVWLAFTNLVGTSGAGWVYAALVLAPVVLPTWLLVRGTKRARQWVAGSVAAVAVLVGLLAAVAPPSRERVEQQAAAVTAPPGGVLLGAESRGNDLCFQRCTQQWLYYAVPSTADSVTWLNEWAAAQGWTRATLDEGGRDAGWCQGDLSLLAVAGATYDLPPVRERAVPPGTERVLVRVGARCR